MTDAATNLAMTAFTCPRCSAEVKERFWGPCTQCRMQLNSNATAASTDASEANDYEATRFEPAMHVTPNHVATKD